jgi:hypothetical protein
MQIFFQTMMMIPLYDSDVMEQVTSNTGGVLEDGPSAHHQEVDDGTAVVSAEMINNVNGGLNSEGSPKQGSDVDGVMEEIPSTGVGSPEALIVGSGEDLSSSHLPLALPPKDEAAQKMHSETTLSKPPRKRAHVET